MSTAPDGCRWCGDTRDHHGTQYTPGRGQHQWEQPTDRQRLERMQTRRAARLAARRDPVGSELSAAFARNARKILDDLGSLA